MTYRMIYPTECLCAFEKNVYILLLLDGMFGTCLLDPLGLKYGLSPTFPCLFSLWIIYPFLKVGYWSPLLLMHFFPFRSVNVFFIYLGSLMLGAHIFTIVISLDQLTPLWLYNDLFVSYYSFGLKINFVEYRYSYPCSILFPCAWDSFFHMFTFTLCVSLKQKWISCRQCIAESCILSAQPLSVFWLEILVCFH